MNEVEAVSNVLKSLGVSSLFAPLLATVLIFYLVRKYVLTGAGDFLKSITKEYLAQNNERIALETRIDIRLASLTESLDKFVSNLGEWDRRTSERISSIKAELGDRIKNIEIVLSDRVFEELRELKSHFEEHSEDMEDVIREGHDLKKKIAEMDTADFRVARAQYQKSNR